MKIFLNDRIMNKSLTYFLSNLNIYYKIQLCGNKSFNIIKLISKYFPQVKICFVFINGKKLDSYFKFKDSNVFAGL